MFKSYRINSFDEIGGDFMLVLCTCGEVVVMGQICPKCGTYKEVSNVKIKKKTS